MTITHHPSDATLAAFRRPALSMKRAPWWLQRTCRFARNAARRCAHSNSVGGVLLDDRDPAEMTAGALDRAMAKLGQRRTRCAPARHDRSDAGDPACAARRNMRWDPGAGSDAACNGARSTLPSHDAIRVFMLKAAPGTKLPTASAYRHGMDLRLSKARFVIDLGRYGAGDFDEADESVEHDPVVEDGVPAFVWWRYRATSSCKAVIGRLLQPFVRI